MPKAFMMIAMIDITLICHDIKLEDNLKRLFAHEKMTDSCTFSFIRGDDDKTVSLTYVAPDNQTNKTHTLQLPLRAGKILDCITTIINDHEHSFAFTLGGDVHTVDHTNFITPTGEIIKLTQTEKDILKTLLKAKNAPVARTKLLTLVWGYRPDLDTHTAETHIYRLRQKIEKDPSNPAIIKTHDQGYVVEQDLNNKS